MKFSRIKDLARFFYLQRVKGFEVPAEPWFDEETRQWFEQHLQQASSYLE